MIRHIVLFSVPDPANLATVIDTLAGYRDIPSVETIEVRRNLKRDAISDEPDVVLHATFADEAALAAYKRHPIYEAGTRIVRPLRGIRIVADCAMGADEVATYEAAREVEPA